MAAEVASPSIQDQSNGHAVQAASKERKASSASKNSDYDRLPAAAELATAADLPVLDKDGKSHAFGSLYTGAASSRNLIVFVRHFFCGMCQDYLTHLSSTIPTDTLASLPSHPQIIIIGCGDPSLINQYATTTSCQYPIYADPTRKLYEVFGMTSTLAGGTSRPDYQKRDVLSMTVKSIVQGLGSGSGALKGGNFSQVGGEILMEDGQAVWCHRMKTTRDHSEAKDILALLQKESR